MWIVYALVVHVLLLGSIFVIYFRSPVITDLKPQKELLSYGLEAPANRLVLIVTDGFRADSFFESNCANVPHLREIFIREGLVGVSRTHVPTESRPGHIALLAGLYEDPSAVLRGWKKNPVDFDTIFHRVKHAYSWGAEDIIEVFEHLSNGKNKHFRFYTQHLDFSPGYETYQLDDWVLKKVKLLLERKGETLRRAKPVIFFLHLLGLDTAGHVHKPGTPKFLQNVEKTERGIYDIYHEFEKAFPDKRTTYLLTSDHGMTDSGSHGAGTPHETDTPFMLWGAGVSRVAPHPGRSFKASEGDKLMPLHEVEQAQLTPLMTSLLGVPPPMNNFGVLPFGFMNVSREYEATAAHVNALQLLEQYTKLQQEHMKGLFSKILPEFSILSTEAIEQYKTKILILHKRREYMDSLATTQLVMWEALQGIDYYHGYYRRVLLLSTTLTFCGWIFYLYRMLSNNRATFMEATLDKSSRLVRLSLGGTFVVLVLFLIAQRAPAPISFYLLLPLPVWLIALQPGSPKGSSAASQNAYSSLTGQTTKWQILLIIGCAELMVFTFFERRLISLGYVAFACNSGWSNFPKKSAEFYAWMALVLMLACFPLLPISVGYQNRYLLLAGVIVILGNSLWNEEKRKNYSKHTKYCNSLILVDTMVCAYLHTNMISIPVALQVTSWLFLGYAFISIALNKESRLEVRLAQIGFNLGSLYATLCTSYEAIFIQLLTIELGLSLSAQNSLADKSVLRLAFSLLLYTFFSFFGTGNIASVSSFDPNIARCFLSHFAPFVIMGLVLLKLLLPVVVLMAVVYAQSEFVRQHEQQIFICLLIICDVMGLNFLFLVRNQGSWLDIGSSISHFVIMEVTTLVLLLLAYAAKLLLHLIPCEGIASKLH
ncbi:uncharacterized protein Dana_GF12912 [Drosophila ananassae]|uniref:GPI ethanolamine phosphate transferase 1 n=1 Tax=Drosophila ananassae TaxID=7217 RepID=B3MD20_DROAN|nr:GPI ethanolamine phosphate transferase 1 [Drosophila ananassae]EDV36335.1 uncharacterized protein Dana_GF12912 [Drosophila ananassae]